MKKYWHVINIGIQNNLTYRFNFLARAVFGLIPLIAMLYVWQKIYSGNGAGSTVGSYSLAQMISYYLLTTVVDALTAVNEDDWQIAADIKDGNISQFLLKPIDYLWYPALPVPFRAGDLSGGGGGAAGALHSLSAPVFCAAARTGWPSAASLFRSS